MTGYSDDLSRNFAGRVGFRPDSLGLFDFGGNVSEWTNDLYRAYIGMQTTVEMDPPGAVEGRYYVIRGSSWATAAIPELRWRLSRLRRSRQGRISVSVSPCSIHSIESIGEVMTLRVFLLLEPHASATAHHTPTPAEESLAAKPLDTGDEPEPPVDEDAEAENARNHC